MKLVHTEILVDQGGLTISPIWKRAEGEIVASIEAVKWPLGSDGFTLFLEEGKKPHHQNGVVEIKHMFIGKLADKEWGKETPFDPTADVSPGDFDASKEIDGRSFCVEWETGNVSSSHRSLNKMALGLTYGIIAGGILVVPTRAMYRNLTDRIGNYEELRSYFPLWRRKEGIDEGILAIFAVEHDGVSPNVPRIGKGTNGRALR
jgi:hypothetical protein